MLNPLESKIMSEKNHKNVNSGPVTIKKYANRRLYDTLTSAYVTLEDLCEMVKKGIDFVVVDAKTNEDITRPVLTQIIFEQESKGYNMLPVNFLRQIISFYDDSLSAMVPGYLEQTMNNFVENQDRMRGFMGSFGEFSPFKQFEELSKQNIDLFEKTMSMWVPSFNEPDNKSD